MNSRQDFEQRALVQATLFDFVDWINHEADIPEGYSYDVETPGRRYTRIVMTSYTDPATGERRGGSVHAFVDNLTGDLLKAASWKAPAKGARYNLLTELDTVKDNFRWSGTYLYADWKRV